MNVKRTELTTGNLRSAMERIKDPTITDPIGLLERRKKKRWTRKDFKKREPLGETTKTENQPPAHQNQKGRSMICEAGWTLGLREGYKILEPSLKGWGEKKLYMVCQEVGGKTSASGTQCRQGSERRGWGPKSYRKGT